MNSFLKTLVVAIIVGLVIGGLLAGFASS